MNPSTNYTRPSDETLLKDAISYARSLTSNPHDAEDLAQQAWLKVFRKYGKVENRRVLYVAMRNTLYDQLRRQKVVQYTALENAPEPSQSLSFGVDQDMEVALEQLTTKERDSIVLNVIQGYTAREIGARMGVPRGTILSHLTRARKKLRRIFNAELKPSPQPAF